MPEPIFAASAELLARSTVLMGIAWAAAAGLRRVGAPASARHLVWTLGLLGLLLLPLLSVALPSIQLPILPASAQAAAGAVSQPGPAADFPAFAWKAASIIYALVASLLLSRVLAGQLALRRLWEAAAPADEQWAKQVAAMASAMGIEQPVELRFAPDETMPMTWATLRPKIVLPADARSWPAERTRMILAHELAHVARRDSLIQTIGSIAFALYWVNPLAWHLVAQLRAEQEHACDDLVLATGVQPKCYAHGLLDVAYSRAGRRFAESVTVGIGGPSQLERRLLAIVGSGARHVFGRRFAAASCSAAILLNTLVAAIVPVATISDPVSSAFHPAAERARTAAAGSLHYASAVAEIPRSAISQHTAAAPQTGRRMPRSVPHEVELVTPVTSTTKPHSVANIAGLPAPAAPAAIRAVPALSPVPPMPPLPVRPAAPPELPLLPVAPEPPRPVEAGRPPP